MAFTPFTLNRVAAVTRFTLWHYRTPDSLATILTDGYFDIGADELVGKSDIIIVDSGDAPILIYVKDGSKSGSITTRPMFSITDHPATKIAAPKAAPSAPMAPKPAVKKGVKNVGGK